MNKLRQNLNIYDNLLEGQTSKLMQSSQKSSGNEEFDELKVSVNK